MWKLKNEEWRKLHKIIKWLRLRWAEYIVIMDNDRAAARILRGKLNAIRAIGRPGRRWDDNIKADLVERRGGRCSM